MNLDNARISFILGAGLSVDATLPHSVGLANKLRSELQENKLETQQISNVALLELLRFIEGGIRFQRGVINQDPGLDVNIEEIANAVQRLSARQSNPLAAYASGWHSRLTELEVKYPNLLRLFENIVYEKLGEWLAIPREVEKRAYISRLTDFKKPGNVVNLFTLNYDHLVETALSERSTPFINGMEMIRSEWKPELFLEEKDIRIFKLHGSLGWVDDELLGICSLEYPRHPRADEIESIARPLIIFGTDEKLTGKEPFLSLLYHFSQEIVKSDLVITIGYGFGDKHLNDILFQRMKQNIKMRLVIVDHKVDALVNRVPELQREPRLHLIRATAKNALNDNTLITTIDQALDTMELETPF